MYVVPLPEARGGLVDGRRVSRRHCRAVCLLVARRQVAAAKVSLDRVDPQFIAALVALEDKAVLGSPRRRPDRDRARSVDRCHAAASCVGWLDPVDAARAVVRAALAHDPGEVRADVSRAAARSAAQQARDPVGLSRAHAVRRQRRGCRERGVGVLRALGAPPHAARDRDLARGAARSRRATRRARRTRAACPRAPRFDPRQADRRGKMFAPADAQQAADRCAHDRAARNHLRPLPREAPHRPRSGCARIIAWRGAFARRSIAARSSSSSARSSCARASSAARASTAAPSSSWSTTRARSRRSSAISTTATPRTAGRSRMFDRAQLAGLDAQAVPGTRSRSIAPCPARLSRRRRPDAIRHVSSAQLRR